MPKHRPKARSVPIGDLVIVRGAHSGRSPSKVKFGSVVVSGAKPTAATVKGNVERSTKALERAVKKIVRPGVFIRPKRDVPLFSAAENEPGVILRQLNGRTERGRLVDGEFRVID